MKQEAPKLWDTRSSGINPTLLARPANEMKCRQNPLQGNLQEVAFQVKSSQRNVCRKQSQRPLRQLSIFLRHEGDHAAGLAVFRKPVVPSMREIAVVSYLNVPERGLCEFRFEVDSGGASRRPVQYNDCPFRPDFLSTPLPRSGSAWAPNQPLQERPKLSEVKRTLAHLAETTTQEHTRGHEGVRGQEAVLARRPFGIHQVDELVRCRRQPQRTSFATTKHGHLLWLGADESSECREDVDVCPACAQQPDRGSGINAVSSL
ncbi:MAG: hypothetical protein R2752_20090 [Vicinamibacterales bacterium]